MIPLEALSFNPVSPSFLQKIFTIISKNKKETVRGDELKKIITEEFDDLSKRLDKSGLQEPYQVRNIIKARKLAEILVEDSGDINPEKVKRAALLMESALYPLGSGRENDLACHQHILKILKLMEAGPLLKKLKNFSKPLSHKPAEEIIREALALPVGTVITDTLTKRAVLSALFATLRQSVGSCFATAPCLIVHSEQPEVFLSEMNELLSTGRLKRVLNGVEANVPLSPTFGIGDLKRPFVLDPNDEKQIDNIGFSPGLLAAFEAVKIIDPQLKLNERVDTCRRIVKEYFKRYSSPQLFKPETLIREILLKHLNITEKDLQEFLRRPRDMVFGGLMMHMPRASVGQKGIGESCQQFLESFDIAKKAFVVLTDHPLLKCWEFTIASFAETKEDFAKWNLYISLGLNPEEPGGIGEILYNNFKDRLERAKAKAEEYNQEYEIIYSQLKMMEGRVKQASTEKELQWLRVEYQARLNEFQTFEEMRDRQAQRAHRLSQMFKTLIEKYLDLFPRYFQEVYDAEMSDVGDTLYDDRPAGFRLIYKHGRMNTSQWTRIDSVQEYVESLASFFAATESELSHAEELKGFENEVGEWVTLLVNHVKTKIFIESAFHRMAARYKTPSFKNPLEHLDKIEKKPWAYTSGGSLEHLLMSYFKLPEMPKVVSRWVESEMELAVFIVDTLRHLPQKIMDEFVNSPTKSFLMQSPTHAFRLIPMLSPFESTWNTETFTYTFIRDQFLLPAERFYDSLEIGQREYEVIIDALEKKIPVNFKPAFRNIYSVYPGRMNPSDLGRYLMDQAESERSLNYQGMKIVSDSLISETLFELLPIKNYDEIEYRLEDLFNEYSDEWSQIKEKIEAKELVTKMGIINLIQACLILKNNSTSTSQPEFLKLLDKARKIGLLSPSPLLFADTNWLKYYFGFVLNPATSKFEFWRLNQAGLEGAPMVEWKEWLDGSRKDIPWGIYTQPFEYRRLLNSP